MAVAFVPASFAAQDFGLSAANRTLAYAAAVGAGSLLVVAVSGEAAAPGTAGVSDSVNGAYAQAGSTVISGQLYLSIWYFENSAAGTPTVTVQPNASTYMGVAIHEYTGVLTLSSLRSASAGASGTSVNPATGNAGSSAGDLVVAAYAEGNGISTDTVASPFTMRCNTLHAAVGEGLGTADDVAAGGNEGATFTLSASVGWTALAAAFKPAAVAFKAAWARGSNQLISRGGL